MRGEVYSPLLTRVSRPPGEQVRVFRFHYISHTGVADLDAASDVTRRKQAGCGRWKEALPGVSRL